MTDVTKSNYPFLAIAKKYNREYGEVLAIADEARTDCAFASFKLHQRVAVNVESLHMMNDIEVATKRFKDIRDGVEAFG